MIYISHYTFPLGPMTMASDGECLIGLWFDGQKYDRANIYKVETVESDLPIFKQTKLWLNTYLSGQQPSFTPPLKLTGSVFRQRVLQILLTIPYGHTTTYGAIAKIIATEREASSSPFRGDRRGSSAQAVGGVVGHNPISIIIPCHRVLGSSSRPLREGQGGSGLLTGYAGGLDRKLWLLNHERNRGESFK